MTLSHPPTPQLHQRSESLKPLISQMYACQQEFYRRDRILVDHLATRALPEILSQYPTLAIAPPPERVTQLTSVIRTRWFDQQISSYIEHNPHAIVVNVGAGLCTRYWRLPTLHPHWYEVTTPEIMKLRQTYFTIVPREQDLEADIRDLSWLTQIPRAANQPILFVMEGVCMYLSPAENKRLFQAIAHQFSDAQVLFDVVSPRFVAMDKQRVSQTQSATAPDYSSNFLGDVQQPLTWGLKNIEDLGQWNLSFTLIKDIPYLLTIRDYPERLDPWMKNFWPILEPFLKESAHILSLQFQE